MIDEATAAEAETPIVADEAPAEVVADAPAAVVPEAPAEPVVEAPVAEAPAAEEAPEVEAYPDPDNTEVADANAKPIAMEHPDGGTCDRYKTDKSGRILVPATEAAEMIDHGFVVAED